MIMETVEAGKRKDSESERPTSATSEITINNK
jgi:hypothetical protein